MIRVYVKPWTKEDGSWEPLLRDILRNNYRLEDICIERDEMGKPFLKGREVFFNVSHSGAYIAIAVSEKEVGVDIEGMRTVRDGMYRKVVQPQERGLIGAERERDFLRLWTLKESFVKAEGKGLRIPMKEYYFGKEQDGFFVNYGGVKMPWTFYIEETLVQGYMISVCGLEKEIHWIAETEEADAV